ncbi:RNA methyltransferase, RsmE family protein [Mycobacterium kansasii 732]|nr:RNA methyltransferase, RsmE family protein [Mycobacterium kansasii 732]
MTVVQALPKSERSELAIELATEAGADAFVAWQAARCVASWNGSRVDKGLRRWRAVARSAARQSRRAYIPAVDGPLSTAALTVRVRDEVARGAMVLALHESAIDRLADSAVAQADSLLLLVGPEGGIAPAEIDALTGAGAVAVRLGPTVLRTSTAAAVALGALGVLTPRWGLRHLRRFDTRVTVVTSHSLARVVDGTTHQLPQQTAKWRSDFPTPPLPAWDSRVQKERAP